MNCVFDLLVHSEFLGFRVFSLLSHNSTGGSSHFSQKKRTDRLVSLAVNKNSNHSTRSLKCYNNSF